MSGSGAEADLAPSRRSRRLLPPAPGGPHGDRGTPFAVAGDFGQAEPPAERLCAAVDRQPAGNQVLVRFELRTTCPAADAGLMMPLTRGVMISTRSPRFLHMVCTPSRLHLVSEPGRLSADSRGVRHGVNFRAGEPGS